MEECSPRVNPHTLAMARPVSSLRLLVLAVGFYVEDIEQVSVAVIQVLYLGQNRAGIVHFYYFPRCIRQSL